MSSVIASRRYASALLSAAEEGQFLEEATEALNNIKETLDHSRDLAHALRSPLINGDKNQIKEVCDRIGAKKAGRIREWCFTFVMSEKGKQLVRDSIVRKVKSDEKDESED